MSKVPAYRYELFITAFEKKVAEYQQMIRRMEKMEQLYNIVKEVGEAANLPNDQKLTCDHRGVNLSIRANLDDTLAAFDEFAAAVGAKLHAAGLHRDGEPSKSLIGIYAHYTFRFPVVTEFAADLETAAVGISVTLPPGGIRDAVIRSEKRTYTYMEEKIVRLEEPRPIGWWIKPYEVDYSDLPF